LTRYPVAVPYRRADTDPMSDDWLRSAATIRRTFALAALSDPVRRRNLADADWIDAELARRQANRDTHSGSSGKSIAPRNSADHKSVTSRPSSNAEPIAPARSRLLSVSRRS
jgi:hypothetical protein